MTSYIITTKDCTVVARYIQAGRTVAFPTGTSYGLAADALSPSALNNLRIIKNRPEEKTFTVFCQKNLWDQYFNLSSLEKEVLEKLDNKPLTLLVQPHTALSHLAQDGLVGLRMIDHLLMKQLADTVSVPLTATSANRQGQTPCYSPACIINNFFDPLENAKDDISNIAAILDGGNLDENQSTTIARVLDESIKIYRQGSLTAADIQRAV